MENFKGTKGEWKLIKEDEGHAVILAESGWSFGRTYIAREIEQGHDEGLYDALLISKSPRMLFRLTSNKLVLENTVTYLNNLLAIVEPHERLKLETNILLLESEIIDTKELIKQATEI